MATWQHDKHVAHDGGNPSRTLLLSNLFYEVSQQELALLFGQTGEIVFGPKIRYDKADRSLGQATLTYKELKDAVRAFDSFNGAIAKGQPISIKYDRTPQPPALLARLDGTANSNQPRNPFDGKSFSDTPYSRNGPRTSNSNSNASHDRDRKQPRTSLPRNGNDNNSDSRDRRGPRKSNERGPNSNNKREKKQAPKTADELDRELDNFMKTPLVTAPAAVKVAVDTSDVVMG